PSVGSGRYSPGPGMVYLLVEVYQVIRTPLAVCSLIRPGNPAIDSDFKRLLNALYTGSDYAAGNLAWGDLLANCTQRQKGFERRPQHYCAESGQCIIRDGLEVDKL